MEQDIIRIEPNLYLIEEESKEGNEEGTYQFSEANVEELT
jgi:hypothetical protein